MDRIVLHCDLNCFYASVELLSRPDLKDVPVAVCGDPTSRHGIILAKNELAKQCGVATAETIWQAKKKCPDLVLLPPHHDLYHVYSKKVNAIYTEYTDLVEPFGIDESWLDITGSCHLFGGDPVKVADEIRNRVRTELGLTLSVGVSFNKVFAKLGSDYKKPDATTLISRENWKEIVYPLSIRDLLFVGRAAAKVLNRYGVYTIGELAAFPTETLEELFGKLGLQLHEYAAGQEHAPVRSWYEPETVKSVGNSTTYRHNLTTRDAVRTGISLLADSVAMRLRHHGLYCSGVQITVKDANFKSITRQKQLSSSTHLMKDISQAAMELIEAAWTPPNPIRLLGVTAINLTEAPETYEQMDLLSGSKTKQNEKQEKVEKAMDAIRARFGSAAISYGTAKNLDKDDSV